MRQGGRLVATPLLVALVVIEMSDLIFALDSIPAVFAVTRDPFLVYTSNILRCSDCAPSISYCRALSVSCDSCGQD